jgi:hypothetical protein
VIIKPAELTPLTALAAAELAIRAGIPAGVLNMITADADNSIAVGKVLCASDVVRHISFTGSTEVGRILMAQSAPTVKKMSLELGGNAPFIVFEDADIDSAVEGAFASKYRNAGQTCVCSNRIYVQEAVYEAFATKFAAKVKTAKVGNGFEDGVNQGPLIEPAALDKVERHVQDAIAKGGRVLTGGKRLGGQFFEPTVIADATADMVCAKEETFGPFAPIFKFKKPLMRPTTPSSAWPATFIAATWAAFSAWPKRWSTAWWASTWASWPPNTCLSAASSNLAWAAKAHTTAWTTMWRSSTSAWAMCSSDADLRICRGTATHQGGVPSCPSQWRKGTLNSKSCSKAW